MFMGQKFPKLGSLGKGNVNWVRCSRTSGFLGGLVICYLLAMFFGGMFTPILTSSDATPEEAAKAASIAKYIGYGIGFALLVVIAMITKFSMGSVLLFVLFVAHALVGAVELGTDQWAQNITGNLFTSEQGKWLFIWTSAIMFALRFCAEWIEKYLKLSPVALLFVCSVLAFLGLQLAGGMTTLMMAFGALGIYAIGKTFFWPTMLAVASDRFPRTGAVAISIMGGIGMMSAGLIGSTGLGYSKDRFAGAALQEADQAVYDEYKAEQPSKFLIFKESYGLDGTKLGAIQGKLSDARGILAEGKVADLDAEALAEMSEEDRKAAEEKHPGPHGTCRQAGGSRGAQTRRQQELGGRPEGLERGGGESPRKQHYRGSQDPEGRLLHSSRHGSDLSPHDALL